MDRILMSGFKPQEQVFSIYRLLQDKEDKPPEISRTKSCPAGSDSARETVTS